MAMGSPLGPIFADFYMGYLEMMTFREIDLPLVYCRYVDAIFFICRDKAQLNEAKDKFESNSLLTFTTELGDI